jgi:uncharacterized UPF0160 family protein
MEIIDASDNGVGPGIAADRISIQEVISSFNSTWGEGIEASDRMFNVAVGVAKLILARWIVQAESILQASDIVESACKADSTIVRLSKMVPWHSTFFNENRPHKFVMYQAGPDDWRLQAIPPSMEESFAQRQPLPEQWAGLRGEVLEEASGVMGATFCHKGLFICGAKTKEAIERMAVIASWSTV